MTTTIKVHVNGRYKTTIKTTMPDGSTSTVDISGEKKGEGDEYSFHLPHPAHATYEITEEQLPPATPVSEA